MMMMTSVLSCFTVFLGPCRRLATFGSSQNSKNLGSSGVKKKKKGHAPFVLLNQQSETTGLCTEASLVNACVFFPVATGTMML